MTGELSFHWFDIESDPKGWDGHVACVGQNLFHRNAMLEAHQYGKAFQRGVLMRRGDRPVGVLGGLLFPGPDGARYDTLSFPRASACLHPTLPGEICEWLLRQGITHIDLGSFDGGVEGYQAKPLGRLSDRLEFVYDLTHSEEERFARLSTNHRRKLKKSEKAPMRLERIESGQALLMTRLNRSWAKRRGESYGLRRVVKTFGFYRRLTTLLGRDGSGNLYGLYDQRDRILSMAYMLERNGAGFYMIGASSEEGYECGAAVRLFWELARRYPSDGISSMNFGGVPASAREQDHEEHGIYRFKMGFGIEPTLRQSLTIEA